MKRESPTWGLLFIVLLMFWPSLGRAEELVQVVRKAPSTKLVDEATVRLMAELGTVGFSVERCDSEVGACQRADAVGRVSLGASGSSIHLAARAGTDGAPVEQTLDLASYDVSAEVVAVRAAELLRAALLGALHAGELTPAEGGAVARFAVWESPKEQEADKEPEPAVQVAEPPVPPPVEEAREPEAMVDWSLTLGPAVSFASFEIPPGVGFELASEVAFGGAYFGIVVGYQPWVMEQRSAEGTIDVRTLQLAVRTGWAAPCGFTWMCHVGLFVGMTEYAFRPEPSAGLASVDASHTSPVLGGDVLISRSWKSGLGAYVRAQVGALPDAPELAGEPAVLLGRPSVGLSLGMSYRLR